MKSIAYLGLFLSLFSNIFADKSSEPVVTAEKYIAYKTKQKHISEFTAPKTILICYQTSSLKHLLATNPSLKPCASFDNLYLTDDGQVGIFGGWGWGAPALAARIEQLIALGSKRFLAVGTAGTLCNKHPIGSYIISPKALAEDGVAQHYLQNKTYGSADEKMITSWNAFAKSQKLPDFQTANAWSFSAIYKETPAAISRVTKLGYDVVEMEAATLYAIGEEKQVQTLSLFVISDSITLDDWQPHIKEPAVRDNLHKLVNWALEYCKKE